MALEDPVARHRDPRPPVRVEPSRAKESSSAPAAGDSRNRHSPFRERALASEDAYQARGGSVPEPGETSST